MSDINEVSKKIDALSSSTSNLHEKVDGVRIEVAGMKERVRTHDRDIERLTRKASPAPVPVVTAKVPASIAPPTTWLSPANLKILVPVLMALFSPGAFSAWQSIEARIEVENTRQRLEQSQIEARNEALRIAAKQLLVQAKGSQAFATQDQDVAEEAAKGALEAAKEASNLQLRVLQQQETIAPPAAKPEIRKQMAEVKANAASMRDH